MGSSWDNSFNVSNKWEAKTRICSLVKGKIEGKKLTTSYL
jgi:hypothetical protein